MSVAATRLTACLIALGVTVSVLGSIPALVSGRLALAVVTLAPGLAGSCCLWLLLSTNRKEAQR